MLNSFVYMFKDKDFGKKYLILFGVLFIANLLINCSSIFAPVLNNGKTSVWYYVLFIAGFILMFIPYGYSITVLRETINDNKNVNIPSLNALDNFISGLKVVLSGSILVFLIALLTVITVFISNLLANIIVSVILNTILILALFTTIFFMIAMCCRYVVKPSFLNFVEFLPAAKLINNNALQYLKVFVISCISFIIVYLISILVTPILTGIGYIGLFIYCLMVSAMWAYQLYLLAGLMSYSVDKDKLDISKMLSD